MFLDVGNRQRIHDPTPEQITHHLGSLRADEPVVILIADDEHFIQAAPAGDVLRVEWRQEAQQRFMLVPFDRAEQAFIAFRRWNEPALESFPWRRLSVFNDPYRQVIVVVVILAALALATLWLALQS